MNIGMIRYEWMDLSKKINKNKRTILFIILIQLSIVLITTNN